MIVVIGFLKWDLFCGRNLESTLNVEIEQAHLCVFAGRSYAPPERL